MKKVILATALSLCVASAFAADTAVLKVTGKLTNAACTPVLSKGGIVDYGSIHLGDLSPTAVNQLGQKNIDLTINCTAATKVAWNMVDDRADSNAGVTIEKGQYNGGDIISYSDTDQTYGVGKTAGGVKIGDYSMFVNIASVVADGKNVDTILMDKGATAWAKSSGQTRAAGIRDLSVATTGTLEPLAFITATFPLVTALAIQDTTKLAITDDTKLDGQLTISLKYL